MMSDNRKYYFLKVKENYFYSEEMKLIEAMDNGYIYSNILLKMSLLSLKNEGKLLFKDAFPYNNKMLSTILNHDIDHIEKSLKIFQNLELIKILPDKTIYMMQIEELVGHGSTEAERKSRYRTRIKEDECKQIGTKAGLCPPALGQSPGQNPPELRVKSIESRIKSIKKDSNSNKQPETSIFNDLNFEPDQQESTTTIILEFFNKEIKTIELSEKQLAEIVNQAGSVESAMLFLREADEFIEGCKDDFNNLKTYRHVLKEIRESGNGGDVIKKSLKSEYCICSGCGSKIPVINKDHCFICEEAKIAEP